MPIVYTLYDQKRRRVYIGITNDLQRRLREHERANDAGRWEDFSIRRVRTRRQAEALEKRLIKKYCPVHNTIHACDCQ